MQNNNMNLGNTRGRLDKQINPNKNITFAVNKKIQNLNQTRNQNVQMVMSRRIPHPKGLNQYYN